MTPYQKIKSKDIRDKMIIDFNQNSMRNKCKEVNQLMIIPKTKRKIAKINKSKNTLWYFNNLNLKMSRVLSKDIKTNNNNSNRNSNHNDSSLNSAIKQTNVVNILMPEHNANRKKKKKNSKASLSIKKDSNKEMILSKSNINICLNKHQFHKNYSIIGNKKLKTVLLEHLSKLSMINK